MTYFCNSFFRFSMDQCFLSTSPLACSHLGMTLSCVMQLAVQYLALNSAAFNWGPLSVLIISPCVLRFPSSNCLFSATMKSLFSSSLHFISSISTFFNSIIFFNRSRSFRSCFSFFCWNSCSFDLFFPKLL